VVDGFTQVFTCLLAQVARGHNLHAGEFIQAMARQRAVSTDDIALFEKFREKFSAKKEKKAKKKKGKGGKKKKKK